MVHACVCVHIIAHPPRYTFSHTLKHTPATLFTDWDGTGAQWTDPSSQGVPCIIASYTTWWALGRDCWYQTAWGSWVCKKWPGQSVSRVDIRVADASWQQPYTVGQDAYRRGEVTAEDPTWKTGYVGQLGYKGSTQRMMPLTRNEGVVGVTGMYGRGGG